MPPTSLLLPFMRILIAERYTEKPETGYVDGWLSAKPVGLGSDQWTPIAEKGQRVFYGGGSIEAVGMVVEKTSAKKLIQPSAEMSFLKGDDDQTCAIAWLGYLYCTQP
ncbi:hypothetical protein Tco_1288799 [Tanacetum coccineum]